MRNTLVAFKTVFLGVAACGLIYGTALGAEHKALQVYRVLGGAEMMPPSSPDWVPLLGDTVLQKNFQVRTASAGFVEVALDAQLEGVLRIEKDSSVVIQSDSPLQLLLIQGGLLLYREKGEPSAAPAIAVKTKEAIVTIHSGGFSVAVHSEGTQVSVFDGEVQVAPLSQESAPAMMAEGFKGSISDVSKDLPVERLTYQDYDAWQIWIRAVYEKRDDLAAEALERGEES